MQTNLLDVLCEKSECAYVSDLTQEKCHAAVAKAAKDVMSFDFDDSEWIAAAEYVSLGKVKAKDAQEAKAFFNNL